MINSSLHPRIEEQAFEGRGEELGFPHALSWVCHTPRCFCCCSVAKSCPTLCDPMGYSMPGLPVHHYLLEFAQTHVHWTDATIQPAHPLASFSSCPQSFPASGSLPMSQLFESDGQSIAVSALASVFSTNFQGWFSLELTGLISLQCKGLSRVFSNTTVQCSAFFMVWLSHHCWKNHSFDYTDLCQQSDASFEYAV